MPRLTVMEEVLLLGLKDKQVSPGRRESVFINDGLCVDDDVRDGAGNADVPPSLPLSPLRASFPLSPRATYPFGTTTSPTPSGDVSSSN
jgi:hypothetical protein